MIYTLILGLLVIPSDRSYANKPFSGLYDYLEENHIYKENTEESSKLTKIDVTKFIIITAGASKLICAVPGLIMGGTIGGTIGAVVMPVYVLKKPEASYALPLLGLTLGSAVLGNVTSFFGEFIIGTPLYITQIIVYDMPRLAINNILEK